MPKIKGRRTSEGLEVSISEKQLDFINEKFNELTRPIPHGMTDIIRKTESQEQIMYEHKLGPEVTDLIANSKKSET